MRQASKLFSIRLYPSNFWHREAVMPRESERPYCQSGQIKGQSKPLLSCTESEKCCVTRPGDSNLGHLLRGKWSMAHGGNLRIPFPPLPFLPSSISLQFHLVSHISLVPRLTDRQKMIALRWLERAKDWVEMRETSNVFVIISCAHLCASLICRGRFPPFFVLTEREQSPVISNP